MLGQIVIEPDQTFRNGLERGDCSNKFALRGKRKDGIVIELLSIRTRAVAADSGAEVKLAWLIISSA